MTRLIGIAITVGIRGYRHSNSQPLIQTVFRVALADLDGAE